jgi:hypothetical protein
MNYAVLHFETKKLDELTSQIKPMVGDTFSEKQPNSATNHRYTNPSTRGTGRTLMDVNSKQYPDWVNKVVDELNTFRKGAWVSTRRLVKYLISLSRPPMDDVQDEIKPSIPQYDVENLADKIEQKRSFSSDRRREMYRNDTFYDLNPNTGNTDGFVPFEPKKSKATIDMVSDVTVTQDRELTQFEVQEKRILRRLKQVNRLDDWDAWFELASLYEKYGELDKASDINCFIMKNGNESDKERAAKNLIGLG